MNTQGHGVVDRTNTVASNLAFRKQGAVCTEVQAVVTMNTQGSQTDTMNNHMNIQVGEPFSSSSDDEKPKNVSCGIGSGFDSPLRTQSPKVSARGKRDIKVSKETETQCHISTHNVGVTCKPTRAHAALQTNPSVTQRGDQIGAAFTEFAAQGSQATVVQHDVATDGHICMVDQSVGARGYAWETAEIAAYKHKASETINKHMRGALGRNKANRIREAKRLAEQKREYAERWAMQANDYQMDDVIPMQDVEMIANLHGYHLYVSRRRALVSPEAVAMRRDRYMMMAADIESQTFEEQHVLLDVQDECQEVQFQIAEQIQEYQDDTLRNAGEAGAMGAEDILSHMCNEQWRMQDMRNLLSKYLKAPHTSIPLQQDEIVCELLGVGMTDIKATIQKWTDEDVAITTVIAPGGPLLFMSLNNLERILMNAVSPLRARVDGLEKSNVTLWRDLEKLTKKRFTAAPAIIDESPRKNYGMLTLHRHSDLSENHFDDPDQSPNEIDLSILAECGGTRERKCSLPGGLHKAFTEFLDEYEEEDHGVDLKKVMEKQVEIEVEKQVASRMPGLLHRQVKKAMPDLAIGAPLQGSHTQSAQTEMSTVLKQRHMSPEELDAEKAEREKKERKAARKAEKKAKKKRDRSKEREESSSDKNQRNRFKNDFFTSFLVFSHRVCIEFSICRF